MTRERRIPTPQLEDQARVMTREALTGWRIPDEMMQSLTLGMYLGRDDHDIVFELYAAGDRPSDAIVLATARLNRATGEGAVTLNYERLIRVDEDPRALPDALPDPPPDDDRFR